MQLVVRQGKLKGKALRVWKRQIQLGSTARSQKENVMKFNPIAQSSLAVLSILLVPVHSFATTVAPAPAPYCIAVNGGFGSTTSSGSTFVARSFSIPDANKCVPWEGYTKTSATVIFTTSGVACLSSDSTALTVSVSSQDPDFLGVGTAAWDYIKMSRTSVDTPFSGQDSGYLTYGDGSAEPTKCTSDLLTLPAYHD
jgi:hypothetical protein